VETKDIITLAIASYGAILSTVTVLRGIREKRTHIKVRIFNGFLTLPVPGELSNAMLFVEAVNVGNVAVTLNNYRLRLPDSQSVYPTVASNPIPLPCELSPGKNYQ
jgi:hypothetical protein